MKVNDSCISPERLRQLLSYDPVTGVITWKDRRNGAVVVGSVAGSIDSNGYRVIRLDRVLLRGSRVAWALYHGSWPCIEIDHINRNPADDRIKNLRQATRSENNINRRVYDTATSRKVGVSWDTRANKWRASISRGSTFKHLGYFDNEADASDAFNRAAS